LHEVERFAAGLKLHKPGIPYVSNVTGTWITDSEATDPGYWARHLRSTVRFSDGVRELLREPGRVLLEVGPGRTLSTLAKQHQSLQTPSLILSSQPHPEDRQSDLAFILNTLAKLWLGGVRVDWPGFYASEQRRRISLPSYPFERQRYWIEPASSDDRPPDNALSLEKRPDIADWFSVPVWQQCPPLVTRTGDESEADSSSRWLVLTDNNGGPGGKLAERLRSEGRTVVTVSAGGEFARVDNDTYVLSPDSAEDYEKLLEHLRQTDRLPHKIVHLWLSGGRATASPARERWEKAKRLGFNSLLFLAQALGNQAKAHDLALYVVTCDMQSVSGTEELSPEKAVVLGPCRVFPREYPNLSCKSIDFVTSAFSPVNTVDAVDQLIAEINYGEQETVIAYRGGRRWRQDFEPLNLCDSAPVTSRLREEGVYLITGGLGGLGLVIARTLAQEFKARLILIGRSTFPPREDWETWLGAHEQSDATSDRIRQLLDVERMGASLLIYSADVGDREQMRRVIDLGVAHFGKIDGVIHAAGVMPAGISQVKSLEMADRVLSPKVEGALVLFDLLHDARLDFMMLCSSVASITGGVGMLDHCAANSVLDAFGHSNTLNRGLYTISVNWGNWLEVGQAAQAKALSDAPRQPAREAGRPCAHPLLERCLIESGGEAVYATELSPEKHWIMGEHKFAGLTAAPGTALLEMVRAAFEERHSGSQKKIIFRDVVFLSPLMVGERESREVQTRLHKDGDHFEFVVMSRDGAASGIETEFQTHVAGKISASEIDRPPARPAGQWEASVDGVTEPEASHSRHPDYLSLGPHWEGLVRSLLISSGETRVSIELPLKFHPELASYHLHPSLLDAATFVPSLIGEGIYLPFAYEKLIIHAPLPPKIYSYLQRQTDSAADSETFAFDIVVTDEAGEVLLEIEDFTLKRVNSTDTPSATSADKSYRASSAEQWERLAPPSDSVAASVSGSGILPGEGAEAFKRTLRRGIVLPQVAVTASNLHALIARTAALTQEKMLEAIEEERSHGQKYARPNIGMSYVEPRSELEKQMVALWGELLGIETVGIYDNFFDLGGHSLLATKLISAVRVKFDAALPLRAIFESPTVAELTLVLVQKQAEQVDGTLLNELLAEIRGLSDAETNSELAEQNRLPGDGSQ
jgi:acyl transferase domain-containing protein